ncbi:alpha/beta hydrolase family esterase [Undibacterium sp. TJN19]|uniref:extracellular catalytic domain type 1 short-chain-length polyhydroxyalkanoate depolymerase n=1 Tax=Undibacterium sp. TJN19 TaxID=3413055 RepID=UPI003BF35AED
MTKRMAKTLWNTPFKRILSKITKTATSKGAKAITKLLKGTPKKGKPAPVKPRPTLKANWEPGITFGMTGARRYRLYRPASLRRNERLPLMVMLHGCGQDAEALAASSKMNQIATRERFLVVYPEQERLANAQACWNWYDTRSGRAQREASSIEAVIDQVCQLQPVDSDRIVLCGLSAGASMAALIATSRPERFRVIAMHSGITTGVAHSTATALMAMRGRKLAAKPLSTDMQLPALLVIQGDKDRVVAPTNGAQAAQQWATQCGAKPGKSRIVQRGARYATSITDYRIRGKLVVTFCEVQGLDHAWSGGAAGHAYSDPKGPDASGMIWAFAKKQFASGVRSDLTPAKAEISTKTLTKKI